MHLQNLLHLHLFLLHMKQNQLLLHYLVADLLEVYFLLPLELHHILHHLIHPFLQILMYQD
jgi:hypothetical protein